MFDWHVCPIGRLVLSVMWIHILSVCWRKSAAVAVTDPERHNAYECRIQSTDRRTDDCNYDANSPSYYVNVRSAKRCYCVHDVTLHAWSEACWGVTLGQGGSVTGWRGSSMTAVSHQSLNLTSLPICLAASDKYSMMNYSDKCSVRRSWSVVTRRRRRLPTCSVNVTWNCYHYGFALYSRPRDIFTRTLEDSPWLLTPCGYLHREIPKGT